MANPNPYKARLARALKRKPGDIDATRRRTWAVLCLAYDEVGLAPDADRRRNAILAYSQVATLYAKTCEAAELEARIQALEDAAQWRDGPR